MSRRSLQGPGAAAIEGSTGGKSTFSAMAFLMSWISLVMARIRPWLSRPPLEETAYGDLEWALDEEGVGGLFHLMFLRKQQNTLYFRSHATESSARDEQTTIGQKALKFKFKSRSSRLQPFVRNKQ